MRESVSRQVFNTLIIGYDKRYQDSCTNQLRHVTDDFAKLVLDGYTLKIKPRVVHSTGRCS